MFRRPCHRDPYHRRTSNPELPDGRRACGDIVRQRHGNVLTYSSPAGVLLSIKFASRRSRDRCEYRRTWSGRKSLSNHGKTVQSSTASRPAISKMLRHRDSRAARRIAYLDLRHFISLRAIGRHAKNFFDRMGLHVISRGNPRDTRSNTLSADHGPRIATAGWLRAQ